MAIKKRLIGYGYTNSNGIATIDYDAEGNRKTVNGYNRAGVGTVQIMAEMDDDNNIHSEVLSISDDVKMVTIPITVSFVNDNNDADGNRPSSVIVYLFAGEGEVDYINITSETEWRGEFVTNEYFDGQKIEYDIVTDPYEFYSTTINGYDIAFSYEPEVTSKTVQITWDDNNNAQQTRPSQVNATITNNVDDSFVTLTLSEENNWTNTATNLSTKRNLQSATYNTQISSVTGYATQSKEEQGNTVTFTLKSTKEIEFPDPK